MAVVRLGVTAKEDITMEASSVYMPTVQRAAKLPVIGFDVVDYIYERGVSAEDRERMRQLPAYYKKTDVMRFHVGGVHADGVAYCVPNLCPTYNAIRQCQIEVEFLPDRHPLPAGMSPDDMSMQRVNGHWLLDPAVYPELAEVFRDTYTKLSEARAKHNTFMSQVEVLLNRHATLSPALREWPGLWALLPQHLKDKHSEVVEKKPASRSNKAAMPAPDIGKLTAGIVTKRVRGD